MTILVSSKRTNSISVGILLFVFYLLLFSFVIKYMVSRCHLSATFPQLLMLFLLKVTLGSLYGYLFLSLYHGDDTWLYHRQGMDEYRFLLEHPVRFFTDLLHNNYPGGLMDRLFEANNSYWKSLEYSFLVKLLAIFDIFSRGYYYVNVIFFSFLTLWGHYLFFNLFTGYFPEKKKWFMGIFFFFLPFIFWTSGIRKDGLILLFAGIVFHQFKKLIDGTIHLRGIVVGGLALFFTFVIRNYVALGLVPALAGWYLSDRKPNKAIQIFLGIYLLGIILFFLSSHFPSQYNLPERLAQRQHEFVELSGGSRVESDTLSPAVRSYLHYLPKALAHVFLRPYPFERNSMLYQGSAIETYFCLVFFGLAVFWSIKYPKTSKIVLGQPFILTCLAFSLVNYLLIGYIVPFIGAIVRYKSIYEVVILGISVSILPIFKNKA